MGLFLVVSGAMRAGVLEHSGSLSFGTLAKPATLPSVYPPGDNASKIDR
jgi:hypothetical protein